MRENIFYFKPRKMLALKTQYVLNVHCSARYVAFSGKRSPISISFLALFMKILRYERAILSCFSPLSSLCSLLTHPENIGKRWIKIIRTSSLEVFHYSENIRNFPGNLSWWSFFYENFRQLSALRKIFKNTCFRCF